MKLIRYWNCLPNIQMWEIVCDLCCLTLKRFHKPTHVRLCFNLIEIQGLNLRWHFLDWWQLVSFHVRTRRVVIVRKLGHQKVEMPLEFMPTIYSVEYQETLEFLLLRHFV